MDYQDKGKESIPIQFKPTPKRKAQGELADKENREEQVGTETTTTEIKPSNGEKLSMEEEILKKLLNEWR